MREQGRFRELLDAAPDAIIETGTDGRVVLANEIALRMFGYRREEFLGRSIEDLIPEPLRARHATHREQYTHRPATRAMGTTLELQALRKNGEAFPVEISLSPIQGDGGIHVIAIVRDVTARRQAEEKFRELQDRFAGELEEKNRQLEQRDRLKSEFLASMSHELRSPLHTIIGFAELLTEELEGPLNAKQKRFVANIQHDSQHLLALINDLLDISKIEAGRMEFHSETIALGPAVNEAIDAIRPRAEAKGLKLSAHLESGIAVVTDRLRLRQILTNLLSNAVKFTAEGGSVIVNAAVRRRRVAVSIVDTGIGIAKEDHDAIFDKFYQVGSTTKGVREGTGLGLAITKRLVEQQGGVIWVCSEPGHGTQFTFTVLAGAHCVPSGRPLVIIVQDQPRSAELLVNFVTPEGFDAFCAGNVETAVKIARELSPDAIIFDLSGPDGHVPRMIGDLRADPATAMVPIVMVSVAGEDENAAARAFGVYAHLTKPVGKRQLLETLAKALAAKPARRPVVAVADDEPMARELLGSILLEAGYETAMVSGGEELLALLGRQQAAAIVLDLVLPGMSGFEVLARIRESSEWSAIPVIVLTGAELEPRETEWLEGNSVALLRKGKSWKQPLLHALRKPVP